MTNKVPFNCLLVPTDFSENSWSAFQHARLLVDGNDSEIVDAGFGERDSVLALLRQQALEKMKPYAEIDDETTNIDTLVCEGEPFFEIVKKAEDFAVDAIVMSKVGQSSQAKTLLFGSTAEKVIRASKKPIIVLPSE